MASWRSALQSIGHTRQHDEASETTVDLKRQPVTIGLLALLALAAMPILAHTMMQDQTVPKPPAATPSPAPAAGPIPVNKMTIVIDPAHGGVDSGSRIGDSVLEKDVTLAFAFKLRSLLSARGFTVVMTRDADVATEPNAEGGPITLDDRAGIANHAHASACLLLHATGSGKGVHLYSSEIDAVDEAPTVWPWLTAQASWVSQSHLLEKQFAAALARSSISLVASNASVRPVDSLTCPALVIELAPSGDEPESVNYADYQQRVAEAVVGALVFWPNQMLAPTRYSTAMPPPVSNTPVFPEPKP